MPITPRTPDEIRQSLIAYLVSTGILTSIDEGDVAGTIFGAFGTEISSLEHKLLNFVNGHLLNVSGDLLDDRVGQIPNVPPRRGASPAKGGSVTLTKSDAFTTLELQPGAVQICDPNRPSYIYVNRDSISFGSSDIEKKDLFFVCLTTGAITNSSIGSVTSVVQGNGIFSCTNRAPFTGGTDREDDIFLRQRAMAMILSLARSQANAIEALALNFMDSTGTTILHARAFEYADKRRGYTELVVSDGQGFPSATTLATASSGTLPTLQSGTRYTFYFDGPAADRVSLKITPPGGTAVLFEGAQPWWIPIEEKGTAWTQEPRDFLVPGAQWVIQGHQVYRGWIREFQDYVNRSCAAAGTRVRVVKPEMQLVTISANCIIQSGRNVQDIFTLIKSYIIEFFNRLAPGEPAFIHRLHDWVAQVPGIVNIIFDQSDLYAGTPRSKLATNLNSITLR